MDGRVLHKMKSTDTNALYKAWRRLKRDYMYYLFLLPAAITVSIFTYRPIIGVVMAFQDFDILKGYFGSTFVGLKHFAAFLENPEFFTALKNTLSINSLMILIGFPLPVIFALILNEVRVISFKRITQTITYLPHFISWVIIAGMFYRMLDVDAGIVNYIMDKWFGMARIPFFRESKYFWAILISVSIWKELGWNSIIYIAALSGIDVEMYEAARIDGAGRFKSLLYITLPGIAPTVGLMFIFSIGTLVNTSGGASFDAIFNMRNKMVLNVAEVLDLHTYQQGILLQRMSYAAAIGLTQSLISLGLVFFANFTSRKLSGYGAF